MHRDPPEIKRVTAVVVVNSPVFDGVKNDIGVDNFVTVVKPGAGYSEGARAPVLAAVGALKPNAIGKVRRITAVAWVGVDIPGISESEIRFVIPFLQGLDKPQLKIIGTETIVTELEVDIEIGSILRPFLAGEDIAVGRIDESRQGEVTEQYCTQQ